MQNKPGGRAAHEKKPDHLRPQGSPLALQCAKAGIHRPDHHGKHNHENSVGVEGIGKRREEQIEKIIVQEIMMTVTVFIEQRLAQQPIPADLQMSEQVGSIIAIQKMNALADKKKNKPDGGDTENKESGAFQSHKCKLYVVSANV